MRKPGKRMASVIASIAAVCVMTGGIGYQAAVSGAQTDSTENSVKAQNTDQQESTDGSFSEEGTTQIGHGQPDAGIYGKCSHNDRGRSLCFIRGYREQRGCPV